MKAPGHFSLLIAVSIQIFIGLNNKNVSANCVGFPALLQLGFLTTPFITYTQAAPSNGSFIFLPQDEISPESTVSVENGTQTSLRRRVVRQFGFLSPALQTMGCLPKLFCGLNSKEPSDDTTTINDLSYVIRYAFSDDLDDESEEKKGKDGHDDDLSEETLKQLAYQEQILEDMADEELAVDDPAHLGFIWRDMMERENEYKERLRQKEKEKNEKKNKKSKKKKKQRNLQLELETLLETLEMDHRFDSFSDNFRKFRNSFNSKRQSRQLPQLESFDETEYIRKKQRELEETSDPNKKLEIAVEAGGRLRNGRQCRTLFNACPYTVEQMKQMINITDGNPSTYQTDKSRPNRPTPIKINDPMQTYMTDDIYIDNSDSQHYLQIEKEEIEKIKQSRPRPRPRPSSNISFTTPATTIYDADSQLMYLIMSEKELELQEQREAALKAQQASQTQLNPIDDDEAIDQIIPEVHVKYTKKESKEKDEGKNKSSEEFISDEDTLKESSEYDPQTQAENRPEETSSEEINDAPIMSKEENHDDEVSVVKEEKVFMKPTPRPKFKYRIKKKNKNQNGDNDEDTESDEDKETSASNSEQEDTSQEQKGGEKQTDEKSTKPTADKNSPPPPALPPLYGGVSTPETPETSTETNSNSTSSQVSTAELNDESEEIDHQIRPFGPYPMRGTRYPTQHNIIQNDEKGRPRPPHRRPLGPLAQLGLNNNNNNHNNNQPHRHVPPPPPNYKKPSQGNRPAQGRPPPQKNQSILSSILNFKVVAPKKRPTRRPGMRRPHKPNLNKNAKLKQPSRRPFVPMAILGTGGLKNPNDNGKRPLPPPPPIFQGKFPTRDRPTSHQVRRPAQVRRPPLSVDPPPEEEESSEETDAADDEADKPEDSSPLPVGPIAALGEKNKDFEKSSSGQPPPPIFGIDKPEKTESTIKHHKIKPYQLKFQKKPKQPIVKSTAVVNNKKQSTEKEEVAFSSEEDDDNDQDNRNSFLNMPPRSNLPASGNSHNQNTPQGRPTPNGNNGGSNSFQKPSESSYFPRPPPSKYLQNWKPSVIFHTTIRTRPKRPSRPQISSAQPLLINLNDDGTSAEKTSNEEGNNKSSEENGDNNQNGEEDHLQRPIRPVATSGAAKPTHDSDIKMNKIPPPPPPVGQWQPPKDTIYHFNQVALSLSDKDDSSKENANSNSKESNEDDAEGKSNEDEKNDKSDENDKNENSNENKNEQSDEDDKENSNENKNNKSEEDDNKENSKENKNNKSEEEDNKENSKENNNNKSEEDDKKENNANKNENSEENKSEEDDKEKDKNENKSEEASEEQKAEDGSSEEENSKKPAEDSDTEIQERPRPPPIEIVSLGNSKPSSSERYSRVPPPPPPIKSWAPSTGSLADELLEESDKAPVAYKKPPGNLPPRKSSPRPIRNRVTPKPPDDSKDMNPNPGSTDGRVPGNPSSPGNPGSNRNPGGNRNQNGNKKKPQNQNREKEKDGQKGKEKDSSEEKDSDEDYSDENDSSEGSSEELQADIRSSAGNQLVNTTPQPLQPLPQIGNSNRPFESHESSSHTSPPTLPPIFKWRSGNNPKGSDDKKTDLLSNENKSRNTTKPLNHKVLKLSLSSEESSKSSSSSIESESLSIREQTKNVDASNAPDSTDMNAQNNYQTQKNTTSFANGSQYEPEQLAESVIKISSENNQPVYSRPPSKKYERGNSQSRKVVATLPPIFGKVGR